MVTSPPNGKWRPEFDRPFANGLLIEPAVNFEASDRRPVPYSHKAHGKTDR